MASISTRARCAGNSRSSASGSPATWPRSRRDRAAAAAELRRLGVAAEFRPRNDIEIGGRKLCGTGGVIDGRTLFFQGTLLADFDPERMIEALRVPVEKLARRDLDDARRRVITLREALGAVPPVAEIQAALLEGFRERLDLEPQWGEVTHHEERLARRLHDEQFGTEEFVRSLDAPTDEAQLVRRRSCAAAALRADLRLEGPGAAASAKRLSLATSSSSPSRGLSTSRRTCAPSPPPTRALPSRLSSRAHLARPVGLSPLDFREVVERARADQAHRRRPRNPGVFSRRARSGGLPTLVFLLRRARQRALWRDFPDQLVRATSCGALLYDRWGSGEVEPLSRPYSKDYLLDEALSPPSEGALANPHFASNPDRPVRRRVDRARLCRKFSRARARGDRALAASLREKKTLAAIAGQIADFERGDLKAQLRRHHGARTEALFARLVEVWTAAPAGAGWGLEEHVARCAARCSRSRARTTSSLALPSSRRSAAFCQN